MTAHPFMLMLFSVDETLVKAASAAGVDAFIVDWERIGKPDRQAGADIQIGTDTLEDLHRVRATTDRLVVCRLNRFGRWSRAELESALDGGADEVLLPMVQGPPEVDRLLAMADGRCGIGILIETLEAVGCAAELGALPITRAYVGLNDLAIERGSSNIFEALVDGTVERVREAVRAPFGFGGLTLPEAGFPVPCRLLISEMARLRCDYSFLRRSFLRDLAGRDPVPHIARIRAAVEAAQSRAPGELGADRRALAEVVPAPVGLRPT